VILLSTLALSDVSRGGARVWAVFYVYMIGFVAAVLYSVVDRFEPEQRYMLKFVIVCIAAAAIATQLLP
jgi:hypothetical protein